MLPLQTWLKPCTCTLCCPVVHSHRSGQTGKLHSPAKAQTCTFMCLSRTCSGLQEPKSVPVQFMASGTACYRSVQIQQGTGL